MLVGRFPGSSPELGLPAPFEGITPFLRFCANIPKKYRVLVVLVMLTGPLKGGRFRRILVFMALQKFQL